MNAKEGHSFQIEGRRASMQWTRRKTEELRRGLFGDRCSTEHGRTTSRGCGGEKAGGDEAGSE